MVGKNVSLNVIWNKTVSMMKNNNEIDASVYEAFDDSFINSLVEDKAVIYARRLFHKLVLEKEIQKIKNYLLEVTDLKLEIEILLIKKKKEDTSAINFSFIKNKLLPNYTFENFIVGNNNSQAHLSANSILTNLGCLYNPLFLYGNSGLGKTHLLHAIGNYIKDNNPEINLGIMQGSEFVYCVVNCSRNGTIEDFKAELSNLDILLIDDIQFIAGKDKSHEVFFSIFNELISNRKQICLTCDVLPNEIKGLEERIISRFNSGLKVNIDSPNYETAMNILRIKLEQYPEVKNFIQEDALSYLATYFAKDVRNLEGSLTRLIFYGINYSKSSDFIDAKLAALALGNEYIVVSKDREKTIATIIKVVADYYNLTADLIKSKSRTSAIATARHVSIYLSRKLLDLSYSKIGEEFNGRDHSTIMNSCFIVEKRMKENTIFKNIVSDIEKKIKF